MATALDAGGTRLRLRALHVMGHSSARIARAVGASDKTIRKLVRGDAKTISPQLHDAIADVYDAWWDKRAPARTRAERSAASAARRRAIAGTGAPARVSTTTSWIPPATALRAAGNTPPALVPPRTSSHPGDLEGIGADDSDHPGRQHQQRLHLTHGLLDARPRLVWRVSWLPGRLMDRNSAITAMTLAEVATDEVNPGHRLWLHIEGWSAELGLKVPDALTWISQPPGSVSSEKDAAAPEDPEAADA